MKKRSFGDWKPIFALTIAGGGLIFGSTAECAPDMRPVIRPPVSKTPLTKAPSVKARSTKLPSTRQSRRAAKGNKVTTPAQTERVRKAVPIEIKTQTATDEGPADSQAVDEAIVAPVDPTPKPTNREGNKVHSLFPNASVAHLTEDKAFRLLVTIDGTKFDKETDDLLRLEKGSMLLSPEHKINIATPICSIKLQEGSVVSVDSTSDTTYIRDFHDRWKGHVVVKVGEKSYPLMPGSEMIVTREKDPNKAWKQAVRHQIRRRGLVRIKTADDVTIYKGDFSIPDAMLKSNHFSHLKYEDNAKSRAVIDEVTKTAALLHITDNRGPFTLLR